MSTDLDSAAQATQPQCAVITEVMQIRAGLYVKLHINAWNNRECKQRHAKALLTQEEPTLEYYDNTMKSK